METNDPDRVDRRSALEVILQSEQGEHHSILYNDATNLSYFYSNYSKIALESLNELILILPHSQPIDYVFNNLTNNGIDVQKWKRDGSLVVIAKVSRNSRPIIFI